MCVCVCVCVCVCLCVCVGLGIHKSRTELNPRWECEGQSTNECASGQMCTRDKHLSIEMATKREEHTCASLVDIMRLVMIVGHCCYGC